MYHPCLYYTPGELVFLCFCHHHPCIRGRGRWVWGGQLLNGELGPYYQSRPGLLQPGTRPPSPPPPLSLAFITHRPASAALISLADAFRVHASPVLSCSKVRSKNDPDTHTNTKHTHTLNWNAWCLGNIFNTFLKQNWFSDRFKWTQKGSFLCSICFIPSGLVGGREAALFLFFLF